MSTDMSRHGLSQNELLLISKILMPFSEKIEKVGIFGSRATKQYTDYSDIDLVLYGDLTPQETARLNTLFDESNLGLKVDLINYKDIKHPSLLQHIDSCAKVLFTQKQLIR